VEDCQLSGAITSATITSVTVINANNVIVHWEITQGGNTFNYDVEYEIAHEGYNLFYLSIVCENGSQGAPSAFRTKSEDTDIIGYTVSAGYNIVLDENGIKDILTNSIIIFPNPTKGELRIESGDLKIESVEIYDISGKKILHSTETTLNISQISTGTYFVKLKTDKGELTKKVIKQ